MESQTFTVDYPRDNTLNVFGDYKYLRLIRSRRTPASEIEDQFFLVGGAVLVPLLLSPEQASACLFGFFMEKAARVDFSPR